MPQLARFRHWEGREDLPPTATGINDSHPLADNLILAVLSGSDGYMRVVRPSEILPSLVVETNIERDGIHIPGGSAPGLTFNFNYTMPQRGAISFYYRNIDTATASNFIFNFTGGTASLITVNTGSAPELTTSINGRLLTYDNIPSLVDGAGHFVTVVLRQSASAEDQECFIDGVLEETINQAMFGAAQSHTVMHVGESSGTFNKAKGVVNWILFHDIIPDRAQIRELHEHPWDVFEPDYLASFISAAGPTIDDVNLTDIVLDKSTGNEINGTNLATVTAVVLIDENATEISATNISAAATQVTFDVDVNQMIPGDLKFGIVSSLRIVFP